MTTGAVPLVIVGAGGHGRETLDVVEAINAVTSTWQFLGFVAAEADADRLVRRGAAHLGGDDELAAGRWPPGTSYVVGIGAGDVRRRLGEVAASAGLVPATLVHPAATVGSDVRLGPGVVLAAGARVTTNVDIGPHSQLNVNAVVSHDSVVGGHVTLSPGSIVNGDCRIDDGAFLGTAAVVVRGCSVGAGAVIGAGAVVVRDVPPGVTAIGVPARW